MKSRNGLFYKGKTPAHTESGGSGPDGEGGDGHVWPTDGCSVVRVEPALLPPASTSVPKRLVQWCRCETTVRCDDRCLIPFFFLFLPVSDRCFDHHVKYSNRKNCYFKGLWLHPLFFCWKKICHFFEIIPIKTISRLLIWTSGGFSAGFVSQVIDWMWVWTG